MKEVFKQILNNITVDKKQRKNIKEISEELINKLKTTAKILNIDVEIILAGSTSRNTNLNSNFDLDFFIRFKNEEEIKKKYKNLILTSFKNIKFSLVHGSREYLKFKYKNYDIEFVPSIKFLTAKQAKNSADISFFHIKYLQNKFKNNKKLISEVLLLKQFLKANDIYGAESGREGFSGYVCELLICYFKSFEKLIDYFDKNTPKFFIDIEKHYNNLDIALKKLDVHKTKGLLIVIDPLLPNRNAAASISSESFSEFVFKSRLFLRTKDIKLFNIRGKTIKLIKKRSLRRGTKLINFKIKNFDSDKKVTKSKVFRKLKSIVSEIDNQGWDIYNFGVTDDYYAFIELESLKVSKAKKHSGPSVFVKGKNFDIFLNKYKNNILGFPYQFKSKIVVDVFRKNNVKDIIKKFLEEFL